MTQFVAVFVDELDDSLKYGQPSSREFYHAYPSDCRLVGWLVHDAEFVWFRHADGNQRGEGKKK